ncbi:hypothetical protein AOLI_G00139350 [Acnodon oligacanthus]
MGPRISGLKGPSCHNHNPFSLLYPGLSSATQQQSHCSVSGGGGGEGDACPSAPASHRLCLQSSFAAFDSILSSMDPLKANLYIPNLPESPSLSTLVPF